MRVAFFLMMFLMLVAHHASAHRVHFSWTSMTQSHDSIQLEHRVHEHDASQWLARKSGGVVDMSELQQQAKVALYIAERFHIENQFGSIEPSLIGAELKGKYLFVYQEVPIAALDQNFKIDTDILMDLHADQVHVVDIRINEQHQTLEFSAKSKAQRVSIDPPASNASE